MNNPSTVRGNKSPVQWQAHQNSNAEVPENTMSALEYAWSLGGIPELDIRQTADGVIIGIHDATPARTASVPEGMENKPVAEVTYAEMKDWDTGIRFGEAFKGEKVPALSDILEVLAAHPERELYLDFKQVDLEKLAELVARYGVGSQIIFAHNDPANCRTVKRLAPEIRTMQWVSGGGTPEGIAKVVKEAAESGYEGLDIIQIHLKDAVSESADGWRYAVQPDFLRATLEETAAAGIELEVLPFRFTTESMHALLDMGIRRFAIDEPKVFVETLRSYPNFA